MIYKILIATDFSKNATHARNYGLNLANTLKADVIIFNAYEIPISSMGTHTFRNYKEVFKKNSINKLAEEIKEAKSLFKNINISFEYVCDISKNAILERSNKADIDLILLGSKGESKISEKLFGGTCSKVINKTEKPLIIVPIQAEIKIPKKIVLATDLFLNVDLITTLKKIAKRLISNIDIITVLNSKDDEKSILSRQLKVNTILEKKMKYNYHRFHLINNNSIENGILNYIKENKVHLLTLIPKHRSFWENLIKISLSKKIANNSTIPLLIIPENI
jgi:nucleotide-binding universal stress UspA family protein